MSDFRADIHAYFDSPVGKHIFGKRLHGVRLVRYAVPQVFLNTGLQAIAMYRLSRWFYTRRLVRVSRLIDRFTDFFCHIELAGEADIGPGFQLHHPTGCVIAQEARIGSNVMIVGAAVTIGQVDLQANPDEVPIEIGDNVVIATGAKILGPIKIGNDVRIGPHCILMGEDVPDGMTVTHMPRQKILKIDPNPAEAEPQQQPAV